jgi:hypothetical protein
VPDRFCPGLPASPDWTNEHLTCSGNVEPYDPADYVDAPAIRARLGYAPDQPLIVIPVGGTAIGGTLLPARGGPPSRQPVRCCPAREAGQTGAVVG